MLFKFVQDLVEQAIKQISKQAEDFKDQVTGPLREILKEKMENKPTAVWTGQGSDRFYADMTLDVIPRLDNIVGFISSFSARIDKGAERMQQAIAEADKKAMTLFALFTGIF